MHCAGPRQVPPNSALHYKLHERLLLFWEDENKHLENCEKKNDRQPLAFVLSFVASGFCFPFNFFS